jgi:hypothetical protein
VKRSPHFLLFRNDFPWFLGILNKLWSTGYLSKFHHRHFACEVRRYAGISGLLLCLLDRFIWCYYFAARMIPFVSVFQIKMLANCAQLDSCIGYERRQERQLLEPVLHRKTPGWACTRDQKRFLTYQQAPKGTNATTRAVSKTSSKADHRVARR